MGSGFKTAGRRGDFVLATEVLQTLAARGADLFEAAPTDEDDDALAARAFELNGRIEPAREQAPAAAA
jgi:hypothetical protein